MSDKTPLSSASINEPAAASLPDGCALQDGTWIESRAGLTWRSTTNLRWATASDPMKAGGITPVLEQAWRCIESGAVSWRRVPFVSLPGS